MYLGCLAIAIFLLGAIVISTLKIGISPMPTSIKAWRAIKHLLPEKSPEAIAELGAGFGHMALLLAKQYPNAKVVAYECSTIPFLVAKIASLFQPNLHVVKKDFLLEDLSKFDLLYAYLFPKAMERLSEKELSGTLIYNNFALKNRPPAKKIYIGKWTKLPIYVYKFNLKLH